jgi:hypothetical protein
MTEAQNLQVLKYLQTGKILTPIEALYMFGCLRLAARIYELKDKGWPIYCERKRTNDGKIVGHYSLNLDKNWWPKRP